MKLLIFAALVALAAADVSHILRNTAANDASAQIIKQEADVGQDGKFQYVFETDNGINVHAHGELKSPVSENSPQHMAGEASWTAPNGEQIFLKYEADENGYQPQGSHIPTPPPIPEAIQRSLEWIRAHPPPPERK